jgi:membrane protein insertase Oxa1/YidC/SpoIIIJ
VTLVYLLGFMLAIPVFMAIYFAFRRSIRFFTAFMIIAAFSSLSYLVFWVLLKVRFYGGILNLSLTSF